MNDDQWKEWIFRGIDGKDAAAIMNADKKKTPLSLYNDKINKDINRGDSFIINSLNIYKKKISALYQLKRNIEFRPSLCTMDGFEYLRASIHGKTSCGRGIIHIGLIGKESWESDVLCDEMMPEKYKPIVQHDLMISGAEVCHFLAYPFERNGHNQPASMSKLKVINVKPDLNYQEKLIQEEIRFWDCVKNKTPPTYGDSDFLEITGPEKLIQRLRRVKNSIKELEDEEGNLIEKILLSVKSSGHSKIVCDGMKFTLNKNDNWRIKL